MASSSVIRRYHVFPSFHGADVRRRFLSHLHNYFASKGITTFKDQEIERGHSIGPELVKAIRESRISIVLLSKNYASSSWCLDELVEILKCKEDSGQTVMTIFYDVDPSSVRKQKGDFGSAFMKTCEGKTEEVKQRWSKALTDVANIEGEHSLNWANEADMIQKIATDVSNKLNVTLSSDFDGMVGLQVHLRKLDSLLCGESDDVKMIGIWGPAGIGKSTIARALYNQLSSDYRLSCFMENLRGGSYRSTIGVDDYDSKLRLQNQLLSKILNQRDMRIRHLGAIKEWLQDQRVLIILDDVDDLEKLEALAREPSWFGPRSRIIVTTEDKKILKAHGINDIYHVNFPSGEEALEILCMSAFKQSSVRDGFEELAIRVARLCGNLPLGLCVVGSSLRGESKHEWELQLSRIESSLDRKIEDVLRVGYDRLSKKDQALFLHIACFFNYYFVDRLTTMLADSNLDVRNGLKNLAVKSLVEIEYEKIVMHSLLKQLGRQVVHEQSDEPGKRQFLVEAEEIRDVLTKKTGTGSVIGLSFDTSKDIGEFSISGRAFEGMPNLRFLRIHHNNFISNKRLGISEDMEYLPRLSILDWLFYPGKRLPPSFQPECLVDLRMDCSNLEKLWGGIQPLPNLKTIDLSYSRQLKELPNLSKATNLEKLRLEGCESLVKLPSSIGNLHKLTELDMSFCEKLRVIPSSIGNLHKLIKLKMNGCVELRVIPSSIGNLYKLTKLNMRDCEKLRVIPSSIGNLHKLTYLEMSGCVKLRVIPTNINLASLEEVDMSYCSQLRSFPDISSNIKVLKVENTKIEDVPASIAGSWLRLSNLEIGSRSLKRLTHVPESVIHLDLSNSDIKKIPDCVIGLPLLDRLIIQCCRKLVSLQSLPPWLSELDATDCGSLKSVCFSFDEPRTYNTLNDCKCVKSEKDAIRVSSNFYDPNRKVSLLNCLKLDEEARRAIIQRWAYMFVCLPGKEVPADFTHKANGNSITISSGTFSASSRFKACFLLSPIEQVSYSTNIVCSLKSKGVLINELKYYSSFPSGPSPFRTEHLVVFSGALFKEHRCLEVDATTSEIQFEFSCKDNDDKIIECGVQILAEEDEIKISSPFDDPNTQVSLLNCLKLDEEARRVIIQRWAYRYVFLPGKEVPAEFTHNAKGNSITISSGTFSASSRFKACFLLSPIEQVSYSTYIVCSLKSKGVLINELKFWPWGWSEAYPQLLTEHLFVFPGGLFKEHRCVEVDANTSEIQFEFSCTDNDGKIIECGVQILAEEGESSSSKWKEQSDGAVEVSKDESVVKSSKHTGWWSWLRKLGLSKKKNEPNSRVPWKSYRKCQILVVILLCLTILSLQ